jgi:hypothetical protein
MKTAFIFPLVAFPLALGVACSASGGSGAGDGDGDGDTSGDGDSTGDGDATGDGDTTGDGDAPGTGGAGTGGAGSGGSGTGGSTPGSGGSTLAGILFSDNFDSAQTGAVTNGATWATTIDTSWDATASVTVVTNKARSAPNSVYVKKGGMDSTFLTLVDPAVFPFSGNKIHVRAYINLPVWPASGHATWMEVGSAVHNESEMRIGAHQGVLEVNHWPGDEETIAPGVTLTPDTWHCLEYAYDKAAVSLEVWLDGTKVEALTVTNGIFGNSAQSVSPPPIDELRFGAEINGANEAWFDDIAVGTEYIGCLQ